LEEASDAVPLCDESPDLGNCSAPLVPIKMRVNIPAGVGIVYNERHCWIGNRSQIQTMTENIPLMIYNAHTQPFSVLVLVSMLVVGHLAVGLRRFTK